MVHVVRDLDSFARVEVCQLRKLAYTAAHGSAIDPAGLDWNDIDDRSQHLGLFREGKLISLLRITRVEESVTFNRILLQKPSEKTPLPGTILSRAATDPKDGQSSLNHILRYAALQRLSQEGIRYVYGTAVRKAKRLAFLESLGYEIDHSHEGWQNSFWRTAEPSVLLSLDLAKCLSKATDGLLKSLGTEVTATTLILKACTFEEILPVWRDHLWPNRHSAIEPISWLNHKTQIDATIPNHAQPIFFAMFDLSGKVCAVVSGHKTDQKMFRSRGLWVHPQWRNKGVARALMGALEEAAFRMGAQKIWTMPRLSAGPFYTKAGFFIENQVNGFEFGPHYLAVKDLEPEKCSVRGLSNLDNKF